MSVFLGLLGVLFIGLKLAHVIAWSWVWVLAPLWVIPVIAIVALAFIGNAFMAIFRRRLPKL